MKAVSAASLYDFIVSVLAETVVVPDKIYVFCHASFLEDFHVPGESLTVSQINAFHNVQIVPNASIAVVHHEIRRTWLGKGNTSTPLNTVYAFYDLLTEWPESALESAENISMTLYLLARALAASSRQVFVNVPPRMASDPLFYVDPDIRRLASKWIDLLEAMKT